MAHWSHKLSPKFLRRNPASPKAETNVQQPQKGGLLSSTLVIALLISSAGLVLIFAWLSILFIFNPEKIGWMNKFLPEWAQISFGYSEHPHTLAEIKASLQQQKQTSGEQLVLDEGENSFLLPVFQQRVNCQSECQELVALQVYQLAKDAELQSKTEKYYRLATQLSVTGLEKSFIEGTAEQEETKTFLPLTQVQRFEGDTPAKGVWFYLRGQYQQGKSALAYGQILYYNPERTNIQQLLSWKSPTEELPQWQQITGGGDKELVINLTVGLEPHLQIYQVKPTKLYLNPIQLEKISLATPAIQDTAYQNALKIARSGLWTPALESLKSIQKQRKNPLPATAQAQIDLIGQYAQITQTQADKIWASPSEQVLADLIDGRWGKALKVFAASSQNIQEIATLLKADKGRLWNRTVAALQVNPEQPEVLAWGALIVAVQQGEDSAHSWLQQQPKITKANLAEIQSLLKRLNTEVAKAYIPANHPSQIIGAAEVISQVKSHQWLLADSQSDLKLPDNQVWYRITVSAFQDGKNWLNYPFEDVHSQKNDPGKFLWANLGLNVDSAIQIIARLPDGEQKISTATIKGVQLHNGNLQLLAAGEPVPENHNTFGLRPLALTNDALEWVQPSPITLAEMSRQNPQGVKTLLPILWRYLQDSGELTADESPNFSQLEEISADWPVQVIDLNNDHKPETVLTISEAAIATLKNSSLKTPANQKQQYRPRTLIVSDSGKVIYTDFQGNTQQALTAIARVSDEQSLALLVENEHNYSLQRWSDKTQRFE
ncbi:hypothetical protein H6G76_07050 [Nostoc sp. FACHB-152]|uniref:hypothetical protein n=1 Tax=unclassified Nostoc TaxID=2593658 RepID=UPI0016855531|nr:MULTISPECIES: hypothetical protein [unclassified Nostoc]MBD2446924.1 hypothetical protein [Nostoc sp. FACHB-152]MBD2467739.1 hypothetical protein [Nostoc sp. FACHB-145]